MGFVFFCLLDLSSIGWLEILCCDCLWVFDSVDCHLGFLSSGDLKFHFWEFFSFFAIGVLLLDIKKLAFII